MVLSFSNKDLHQHRLINHQSMYQSIRLTFSQLWWRKTINSIFKKKHYSRIFNRRNLVSKNMNKFISRSYCNINTRNFKKHTFPGTMEPGITSRKAHESSRNVQYIKRCLNIIIDYNIYKRLYIAYQISNANFPIFHLVLL